MFNITTRDNHGEWIDDHSHVAVAPYMLEQLIYEALAQYPDASVQVTRASK